MDAARRAGARGRTRSPCARHGRRHEPQGRSAPAARMQLRHPPSAVARHGAAPACRGNPAACTDALCLRQGRQAGLAHGKRGEGWARGQARGVCREQSRGKDRGARWKRRGAGTVHMVAGRAMAREHSKPGAQGACAACCCRRPTTRGPRSAQGAGRTPRRPAAAGQVRPGPVVWPPARRWAGRRRGRPRGFPCPFCPRRAG